MDRCSFRSTSEAGAEAVDQFACRQQPVCLDHSALPGNPGRILGGSLSTWTELLEGIGGETRFDPGEGRIDRAAQLRRHPIGPLGHLVVRDDPPRGRDRVALRTVRRAVVEYAALLPPGATDRNHPAIPMACRVVPAPYPPSRVVRERLIQEATEVVGGERPRARHPNQRCGSGRQDQGRHRIDAAPRWVLVWDPLALPRQPPAVVDGLAGAEARCVQVDGREVVYRCRF